MKLHIRKIHKKVWAVYRYKLPKEVVMLPVSTGATPKEAYEKAEKYLNGKK